jgi:predicted SprT family Zn-dependent metalloprotease
MDVIAAQTLARKLMDTHGLSHWGLRFDRAAKRFGLCNHTRKIISLSWKLVMLNTEEEVRDTILHEIAHALTPGAGHGPRWREMCVRIGAKPERCFTAQQVVMPTQRPAWFQIGCVGCDWWADRRRASSKMLICKRCQSPVAYRDKRTGKVVQTDSKTRVRIGRA